MVSIKSPVSWVGNKAPILPIIYSLFPLEYDRFVEVFGGSGSVLLGKPPDPFEVYNDFDRNLVNLFHCMKERTMATIRELGFCNLNSRADFQAIKKFFQHEQFDDRFLAEEMELTEVLFPSPAAEELQAIRQRVTKDYDVRRAAMYLKLLRYSYSSGKKSFASQPCDLRRLFGLIQQLENRLANVVIENQDFETLIHHYDRSDTFFYLDPPYFSTEDMYAVEFAWADHVRLRDTAANMQGRFLLSYNDCPEIRDLYDGFPVFDFKRVHSMAQRYEAGKEFKEQYYVENSNLPIVSKEVYQAAQELQESRNVSHKHEGDYPLTGVLHCPECGRTFRRLFLNGTAYWLCSGKAAGATNCQSRRVRENAVYDTFCLMVDKLASHRQDLLGTLIHQLEMMQKRGGESQERVRQIDKQIADLSAQNLVVARLHTNGVLNATDFAAQSSVISNKINALRLDRKKALTEDEDDELIYTLKSLDDTLAGYVPGSPFSQRLFEEIVQGITVVDNARLTFHLVSGLAVTEQIPENARCRTA